MQFAVYVTVGSHISPCMGNMVVFSYHFESPMNDQMYPNVANTTLDVVLMTHRKAFRTGGDVPRNTSGAGEPKSLSKHWFRTFKI